MMFELLSPRRKPRKEQFLASAQALGCLDDLSRVAHVGDSLHHDVAGAAGAGIASIFVASGIHATDLDVSYGQLPSRSQLEALFLRELPANAAVPTHVVSSFSL
jgi:ribonucleotide monophosphatase NagD (HAD superfamily)